MGRCFPISKMLRLVVTVCLVALVAGHGGSSKMKKYAHMKIQQSCFGEEYINGEWDLIKAASKKCSTQPQLIETDKLDFQDVIDEIRNMALPWGSRSDSSAQQFNLVAGGRGKRHVTEEKHSHTTAEKLYHLKDKMACMISNMTCMLRDLDYLKNDSTPNFATFETKLADWTGSAEMKEDLTWAMDVCKDFSMCISPQRAKSPFMKELGHYISFAKCMEMKKMMLCMKHDYIKYAEKEGYGENIKEILDNGLGMGMKHSKKENMGLDALTATMGGDLIF